MQAQTVTLFKLAGKLFTFDASGLDMEKGIHYSGAFKMQ